MDDYEQKFDPQDYDEDFEINTLAAYEDYQCSGWGYYDEDDDFSSLEW